MIDDDRMPLMLMSCANNINIQSNNINSSNNNNTDAIILHCAYQFAQQPSKFTIQLSFYCWQRNTKAHIYTKHSDISHIFYYEYRIVYSIYQCMVYCIDFCVSIELEATSQIFTIVVNCSLYVYVS